MMLPYDIGYFQESDAFGKENSKTPAFGSSKARLSEIIEGTSRQEDPHEESKQEFEVELPFVSNIMQNLEHGKDDEIYSQGALIVDEVRQVRDRQIQPKQKLIPSNSKVKDVAP